ncbi:uncharacterized protein tedc1 isoform X2 [Vanacampus margaritifer]
MLRTTPNLPRISREERHKGSVEVKQVIGILCKVLTATGLQDVPAPETFRRAKFGDVNVEDQFWQLLASILQMRTLSTAGCTQMKNVSSECKTLVSTGLWRSGYYAGWMYGSEVGGVSSRELLLALGWLLAAGTLEKLLTVRVKQLDKTLVPPILMKLEIPREPLIKCSSVRRLQWLIGCLRHQGRMLLSTQDEGASLLHAVFSASLPSRSSSSGQSCSVLKEDSVVDFHEKDAVTERPSRIRGAVACHPGQLAVDKLDDILLKLQTVQKGQQIEKGDVKDRRGRLQRGFDAFRDTPYLVCQAYRARFQAGKTINKCSVKSFHCTVEEADELPVSQVVGLLSQTERQLLDGRDTQRLANRMQLQDIIGRLDQLVLIPP